MIMKFKKIYQNIAKIREIKTVENNALARNNYAVAYYQPLEDVAGLLRDLKNNKRRRL